MINSRVVEPDWHGAHTSQTPDGVLNYRSNSTKTANRKQAEEIGRAWERAASIEYLIRHRLHQAAHLLHDRRLKVAEIGERVGYTDSFQFSKLFKKHFGVSPREWRRNNS